MLSSRRGRVYSYKDNSKAHRASLYRCVSTTMVSWIVFVERAMPFCVPDSNFGNKQVCLVLARMELGFVCHSRNNTQNTSGVVVRYSVQAFLWVGLCSVHGRLDSGLEQLCCAFHRSLARLC